MGSYVALSAISKNLKLSGLILSGSSHISPVTLFIQRILIKIVILIKGRDKKSIFLDSITMRTFNDKFKPTKTPNDWISSDPNSVNDYTNDPLCGFMVTNSLWNDLCKGLIKIFHKNFYSSFNVNIPILIISGKNDAASSNGVLANKLHVFLSTIFNNVSIKLINDARHEVFTEINKESTYKLFLSFIQK